MSGKKHIHRRNGDELSCNTWIDLVGSTLRDENISPALREYRQKRVGAADPS
jgi:hypothetical protein